MPQLSGRGLGHTGGTLDKLESIPGWRAALTNDELFAQLRDVGAVICAAGSGLAPADKKLYALRDVTGTVEAIPLIASSIMSKKIAEGTDSLVLDVKFGSGAFMRDIDRARELARTMVALGTDSGVATTALLTDMNTPLGLAIGNANEVRESVEVLAGGGPADVVELTVALAREMLALAGQPDADVEAALRDGRAMDAWRAMIRAQDGDPDAALPAPRETHTVTAAAAGVVTRMDALPFGIAAWRLGAGRARAEDAVIHAAGIDLHVKPGDEVAAGSAASSPCSADDESRFERALDALEGAWDDRRPRRPRAARSCASASPPDALHRPPTSATPTVRGGRHAHRSVRRRRPGRRLDPEPARRCRCTITSTAACARRRSSSSPTRSGSTCPRATPRRSPTGSPRRATRARSSST